MALGVAIVRMLMDRRWPGETATRPGGHGVPATCPTGGATADSHGHSRTACQQTRRPANPQLTAMQRHRPQLSLENLESMRQELVTQTVQMRLSHDVRRPLHVENVKAEVEQRADGEYELWVEFDADEEGGRSTKGAGCSRCSRRALVHCARDLL